MNQQGKAKLIVSDFCCLYQAFPHYYFPLYRYDPLLLLFETLYKVDESLQVMNAACSSPHDTNLITRLKEQIRGVW